MFKPKIWGWAVLVTLILTLGGCSELPDPQERFDEYLSAWKAQDFKAMYHLLSVQSKEKTSEEEFVERHTNIYSGIELSNLQIDVAYPEDIEPNEENEIEFPIHVSMETLAGHVEFPYQVRTVLEEKEEGQTWSVHWNEQMIFPQLEEGDEVRVRTEKAPRGGIYDRNGNEMAVNGEIVEIGLHPAQLEGTEEESLARLSEELHVSVEYLEKQLNLSWVGPDTFVPVRALSVEDRERVEQLTEIPGVTYRVIEGRVYPYREVVGHLTGYIAQISAEELEALEDEGYSENDLVGKAGLEKIFEERLRGEDGGKIYTVDEEGEEKEIIAQKEPVPGEDIYVTIDIELQQSLFAQLEGDSGTATAIHPQTGEVLALVSRPAYDPNLFILGVSDEQWTQWQEHPEKPLLARFAQTYSPGSTFKPVTAAIGIETGSIDPDEERNITGLHWRPDDSSWDEEDRITRVSDPGEPVDLSKALIYSDNIYFAQTALAIGEENFFNEIDAYGFGEEIPFEYPVKASQLANNDSFRNEVQLADTGYGQGEVSVNPLHLGLIYASLVNEGDLLAPVLELDKAQEPRIWHEDAMSPETARRLMEDLIQVVEHPRGTAREAKIDQLTIAGKTGTAELKSTRDEKGKELGWFVGMDADDPELLITMMIENVQDHGGSSYVIPKVRTVMERYLEDE